MTWRNCVLNLKKSIAQQQVRVHINLTGRKVTNSPKLFGKAQKKKKIVTFFIESKAGFIQHVMLEKRAIISMTHP